MIGTCFMFISPTSRGQGTTLPRGYMLPVHGQRFIREVHFLKSSGAHYINFPYSLHASTMSHQFLHPLSVPGLLLSQTSSNSTRNSTRNSLRRQGQLVQISNSSSSSQYRKRQHWVNLRSQSPPSTPGKHPPPSLTLPG